MIAKQVALVNVKPTNGYGSGTYKNIVFTKSTSEQDIRSRGFFALVSHYYYFQSIVFIILHDKAE